MRNFKKIIAICFIALFSFVFFACKKQSYFYVEFIIDGDVIKSSENIVGSDIVLPDTPTSEVGVFDGWYLDENVWSEPINEKSFSGQGLKDEKIKVYGKWKYNGELYPIYERVNGDGNPGSRDYILFGEYPQTIMESTEIMVNFDQQDSRGYYLGSDGYYYAYEKATPYENSGYYFSSGTDITYNKSYYFKVEPIKWRILNEENGKLVLLCEDIITNRAFSTNDKSEYLESSIRSWLNDEFYNIAFNSAQKKLLITTTITSELLETLEDKETVEDNIFLLSKEEAEKSAYGLNEWSDRNKITTDYSRATGIAMLTDDNFYGEGIWWLRTPYEGSDSYVHNIDEGKVGKNSTASKTSIGIVPALRIELTGKD